MPTYCDKCEAVIDRDEERTHINGEDLCLDCADPSSTTIGLFKTIAQHRGQLLAWVKIDGQIDQLVGIKSVSINGNAVQMEIDMADVAAFGEDPIGPAVVKDMHAALDLFAALQTLCNASGNFSDPYDTDPNCWDKARAAIAKATGGAE